MIIRTIKNKNYTVLNNTVLEDPELSWEAKGMAAYLLSKPDDWKINSTHLWHAGKNGIGAVKRILRELEAHRYLVRKRYRDENGKLAWEHVLHETPVTETHVPMGRIPSDGFPSDGNPYDGFSSDGNPSDIVSTDLPITEEPKTEAAEAAPAATASTTLSEAEISAAFKAWTDNMPGTLTPILTDDILEVLEEYSVHEFIAGIRIAVEKNVRNLSFVRGCLRKGVDRGPVVGDAFEREVARRQNEWKQWAGAAH